MLSPSTVTLLFIIRTLLSQSLLMKQQFGRLSAADTEHSCSLIITFFENLRKWIVNFWTLSNNFLSIFSPERSFMKCSPATQSSNLTIEIDKVICMNIVLYVFYMCLNVYMCLYKYVLFALVYACSYLHKFTYSFCSYRGLIRLHFVLLHCYKY